MASAISESADALKARNEQAQAIWAKMMPWHKNTCDLNGSGCWLIWFLPMLSVPTSWRAIERVPATANLTSKRSLYKGFGLLKPIRVEVIEDGYELIQGFRRFCAFRELLKERGGRPGMKGFGPRSWPGVKG